MIEREKKREREKRDGEREKENGILLGIRPSDSATVLQKRRTHKALPKIRTHQALPSVS